MNDPILCPFCGGEIEYDEENDYHVCYGCGFQYSTDAGRDVDEAFLKRRPPFTVLVEVPEPFKGFNAVHEECSQECFFRAYDYGGHLTCRRKWHKIIHQGYAMIRCIKPGPGCPRYEGEKK